MVSAANNWATTGAATFATNEQRLRDSDVRTLLPGSNDPIDPRVFDERSHSAIALAALILNERQGLENRFKSLVAQWKSERNPYSSSPVDIAMCSAYQKIIAIGPHVIPLILGELRRKPDHWFWALGALTDADPVKDNHRGDFNMMVQDWLQWGRENGFLFS